MRLLLLAVAVLFVAGIGALTIRDMAQNGVTWLDAVAFLVLVLIGTGVIGALLHPPEDGES